MNMDNPKFSTREKDVVDLLKQAMSNKQMALKLSISEHTVEFHLKNIYAKLGVSSKAEAIVRLGKSTGTPMAGKPGESAVDQEAEKGDNQDSLKKGALFGSRQRLRWPRSQSTLARHDGLNNQFGKKAGRFFIKYKIFLLVGIVLALVMIYIFSRPAPFEKYERECEFPDDYSVGQVLDRLNASGSKVHGQFGTTAEAPWEAKAGFVIYKNLNIPQMVSLFLQLRYSKSSPASASILVYLDDEAAPRASIYPKDLGNWDQFAWTAPVYLGKVKRGTHSLKFYTQGQQYGVVDLDQFRLTSKMP